MQDDLLPQLRRRTEHLLFCEMTGDVDGWYEAIDPQIRAQRVAERDDEPELTKSGLRAFMATISDARLVSIEIARYKETSSAHCGNRPVALVESTVAYDGGRLARFRTPWVLEDGVWFTRAVGKINLPRLDQDR